MQFPLLLFCQILDGIDRQRNRENQADRGDSRYAAWRFRPDVRVPVRFGVQGRIHFHFFLQHPLEVRLRQDPGLG